MLKTQSYNNKKKHILGILCSLCTQLIGIEQLMWTQRIVKFPKKSRPFGLAGLKNSPKSKPTGPNIKLYEEINNKCRPFAPMILKTLQADLKSTSPGQVAHRFVQFSVNMKYNTVYIKMGIAPPWGLGRPKVLYLVHISIPIILFFSNWARPFEEIIHLDHYASRNCIIWSLNLLKYKFSTKYIYFF